MVNPPSNVTVPPAILRIPPLIELAPTIAVVGDVPNCNSPVPVFTSVNVPFIISSPEPKVAAAIVCPGLFHITLPAGFASVAHETEVDVTPMILIVELA
jgi:hypothetical protein